MAGAVGVTETSPRLAEILGRLSLVTDMAAGVPPETSVKTCVVGITLARTLGLEDAHVSDGYYTALLRHLGCTSFAHEAASLAAGDDHHFLQTFEDLDPTNLLLTGTRAIKELANHAAPGVRLAAVARVLTNPGTAAALALAQCSQAAALATDMAMAPGVVRALGQIFERYDGRGPRALGGEAIELAARLLHVATTIEIHHRHGGRARAEEAVRSGAGRQLDPRVAEAFLTNPSAFWPVLESPSVWEAYLDGEPDARRVDPARSEELARAFASFADLKIPSKVGHSTAVARLTEKAALVCGLRADEISSLRVAALLHDVGVVAVQNGIWEKRGPLNDAEWERVRLHAYYTQRVLARIPSLGPIAELASLHHERCDGSGYPRGAALAETQQAAQLLAAADVYCALVEPRSYRRAHTGTVAADLLRDEARAGRLGKSSVDCLLAAVGHGELPAAVPSMLITKREVEVLVALARGWTNKEIGAALGISAKTVQHHLAHIYEKIGVNTRAGAALFAARNNLIPMP